MEIFGIDVGGSGIKGAPVNVQTGELVTEKFSIVTPQPAEPNNVADAVNELLDHFSWQGPVGCGFPTVVVDGKCKSSGNIDESWISVQIDQLFSERTGNPFIVVNDADAAGHAEMIFGNGKGKEGKVMMITIGTGLGSALFLNGNLVPNMEMGRINSMKGEPIEFYASGRIKNEEGLNLEEWAKRFDYFLNHVDRICAPNHFIIGGGISKRFDEFRQYLTVAVPIEVAKMGNDAGIVGAAMAAR